MSCRYKDRTVKTTFCQPLFKIVLFKIVFIIHQNNIIDKSY
jgi:hypothetical protein